MLSEIRIRNLALIDDLSLTLRSGLNVLTGETGAGKSMIVESLNLLVGGKADGSRVRGGCEAAEIEGLFTVNDGDEIVLRRVVGADGRSRSYINGRLATLRELAEEGTGRLELHSQNGHQALVRSGAQLEIIDRFGAPETLLSRAGYRELARERVRLASELEGLRKNAGQAAERSRYLEWRVAELERAALVPDEEPELEAQIARHKHAVSLHELVGGARDSLDGTALDALGAAIAGIERAIEKDGTLEPLLDRMRSAAADLEEASGLARDYLENLSYDERELDRLQERLYFLKDLSKKFGSTLDELIVGLEKDRMELDKSTDSQQLEEQLNGDIEDLEKRLMAAAEKLSVGRRVAAGRFSDLVGERLADLAFTKACFEVDLSADDGGAFPADGRDRVEFRFSANAGEPLGPLGRVASGGELSRVMLAIRSVFGELDSTPTLVFDEIDAGIGGAAAVKVGDALSGLARDRQVICVTHLASIAAFADHHLAVIKSDAAGRAMIEVRPVTGEERLLELSRLGGTIDRSVASIDYARSLVDQAEANKPGRV